MRRTVAVFVFLSGSLAALVASGEEPRQVTIANWPAPPFWSSSARRSPDTPRTSRPRGTEIAQALPSPPLSFVAVTPCRIVDTRVSEGAFAAGETRTYLIGGGFLPCIGALPRDTAALSLNITVTQTAATGFVTGYPLTTSLPAVASVAWTGANQTVSNAAVVAAEAGPSANGINIYASQSTHVILDVNGYYGGFSSRKVVDAEQQAIGDLVVNPGSTAAIRIVSGFPVLLPVAASGFLNSQQMVLHTTPDCSGTRYFPVDPTALFRTSGIVGGKLLFGSNPVQSITANSIETFQPSDNPGVTGPCSAASIPFRSVGVLSIVDLTSFAGPFAIQ